MEQIQESPEVKSIQLHKGYKKVDALGDASEIKFGDEKLYTCVYRDVTMSIKSIPFANKVDCAVRIGFVDATYAEEIKKLYQLRNLAHIETEAEKQIEMKIEHAKSGYWRVKPFLQKIALTFANERVGLIQGKALNHVDELTEWTVHPQNAKIQFSLR